VTYNIQATKQLSTAGCWSTNRIDVIVRKMRNDNPVGNGRHSDDFILGFEVALRILANANGSFAERLKTV
jgi:hypothetical protein